tara:strand:- start:552 stop:734 length:183 start_codon:yes stop_codon:yes gene_type:complete
VGNKLKELVQKKIKENIQGLTSSTISDSEMISGPVQIAQKKRIVTGQNNIPIKGERYLIQ